jgi:protein-tyrosine phosphatase
MNRTVKIIAFWLMCFALGVMTVAAAQLLRRALSA